jgi:hypothetical protein
VVESGLEEVGEHLVGASWVDPVSGGEQVVEAADLGGRGPMGEIEQGISMAFSAGTVALADPDTSPPQGIVEAVAGILQGSGDGGKTDPVIDPGGSVIVGDPDHGRHISFKCRVVSEGPGFQADVGSPEDAYLGEAGGVEHEIPVDLGKARVDGILEVH